MHPIQNQGRRLLVEHDERSGEPNVFPVMEDDEYAGFVKELDLCEPRKEEAPYERRTAVVAEVVRSNNPPPRWREPCLICGKYEPICHWHHVVPVREAAEALCDLQLPLPNVVPYTAGLLRMVSLCPTHHRLLHALSEEEGSGSRQLRLLEYLTPQERDNLMRLIDLATTEMDGFVDLALRSVERLSSLCSDLSR